jgi:hypothetical protein
MGADLEMEVQFQPQQVKQRVGERVELVDLVVVVPDMAEPVAAVADIQVAEVAAEVLIGARVAVAVHF